MLQFKLYYFANPNTVRIQILGIQDSHLEEDIPSFSDGSNAAQAYLRSIQGLTESDLPSLSHTAHEISIKKNPRVTWKEVMLDILKIIRDRFDPHLSVLPGLMPEQPYVTDRDLTEDDFVAIPHLDADQKLLFALE